MGRRQAGTAHFPPEQYIYAWHYALLHSVAVAFELEILLTFSIPVSVASHPDLSLRLAPLVLNPSPPPAVRSPEPSSLRCREAAAATPNGAILIDWERAMPSDSPPAEVEVVGFSSSPMTPQPPTARQADADAASGGSEGDPAEFKGFTDQQLREKINCWRDRHRMLPDGGEKMRIRLSLIEKELSRRHAAGPRKVSKMWVLLNHFGGPNGGYRCCVRHCVLFSQVSYM